ncbi:hypothetical protein DPMN_029995 [Dreissena polymorpha]|uniref:Uncharacterized protein n=1 Tax=Dreissena polymorpha TaxID=45954 RepID=A0A9D4LXE3_DREPO|nr:hypothetical protein DPMN_029995 [Dreissena polymorpha]
MGKIVVLLSEFPVQNEIEEFWVLQSAILCDRSDRQGLGREGHATAQQYASFEKAMEEVLTMSNRKPQQAGYPGLVRSCPLSHDQLDSRARQWLRTYPQFHGTVSEHAEWNLDQRPWNNPAYEDHLQFLSSMFSEKTRGIVIASSSSTNDSAKMVGALTFEQGSTLTLCLVHVFCYSSGRLISLMGATVTKHLERPAAGLLPAVSPGGEHQLPGGAHPPGTDQ